MAHALLAPSSAKQWMACPPSIRFSEGRPEPPASEDARTGTLAHKIAETRLLLRLGRTNLIGYKVSMDALQSQPLYFPAMEEYLDTYIDYVMALYAEAKARSPDAQILVEERYGLQAWVPECYGTADVAIFADGILDVVDLKFGQGVPVDAAENAQTRLYALGAYGRNDEFYYDIREARMHIVQPRLDSITTETLPMAELLRWAEEEVKPAAQLAYDGEGEFQAGDHCRWCLSKNVCRAHAAWHLELARYDFREPAELTDEEMAEILTKSGELSEWAKRVREYALEQALHQGKQWPGWKLVAGRANRKITDEQQATAALVQAGCPMEKICKLRGLGDLEDEVGPKRLPEVLGALLVKPEGKPALAPAHDKRPALRTSAEEDFEEEL